MFTFSISFTNLPAIFIVHVQVGSSLILLFLLIAMLRSWQISHILQLNHLFFFHFYFALLFFFLTLVYRIIL